MVHPSLDRVQDLAMFGMRRIIARLYCALLQYLLHENHFSFVKELLISLALAGKTHKLSRGW